MKKSKPVSLSFRCTAEMKSDILKRSLEERQNPSEYVHSIVEKHLLMKSSELPEREKTFIENQFQSFADQLLTFFNDNIEKRLIKIESQLRNKEDPFFSEIKTILQTQQMTSEDEEIIL